MLAQPRRFQAVPPTLPTRTPTMPPRQPLRLPQHEPDETRRQQRRQQVLQHRRLWEWNFADPGVPPSLQRVPRSELPMAGMLELLRTQVKLWALQLRGFVRRLGIRRASRRQPLPPFHAYDRLFTDAERPALAQRWREDEEFAMQRLNGLWPDHIARCTALPPGLALDDATLARLLPPGQTLEGMLAQGLLYVVDQPILQGFPQVRDHVTAVPTCLFFADLAGGRLMPLAVKLAPEPDAPVFTPLDPPGLWLAVKTFANQADLIVHVAVQHFLRMHFAMEVVYVAMCRSLSVRHPLRAFVAPHFYLHVFADQNVRAHILKDTDWWLVRKAWPTWSFADLDVPEDFRRRGVDDPERLPNFHFRDESLALWGLYRSHVEGIVTTLYASDADVSADEELQAWWTELRDPRFGGVNDLPGDADGHLTRRESVTALLTRVLFTVTSRHSHNTNLGRQYYAYTPNTPLFLTLPLPVGKAEVDEATLSAALPPLAVAAQVIAEIECVQNLPGTFDVLGRYDPAFLEAFPEARAHVHTFRARLEALEAEMRARDPARQRPWPHLHPSITANSIWN